MNPSGKSWSRYLFHPEEIFLFLMIRCHTGRTITELVDDVFGGECNRWSYGYPWILKYLDCRYQNIIGHQGLLRYLKDFPKFHKAIKHYVTKAKVHDRNDGGRPWRSPGLSIMPHLTCMFVDCSIVLPSHYPVRLYLSSNSNPAKSPLVTQDQPFPRLTARVLVCHTPYLIDHKFQLQRCSSYS